MGYGRLRQTHTYSTLGVSAAAFDEIRGRLARIGEGEYLSRYVQKERGGEVIVFGEVGLTRESDSQGEVLITQERRRQTDELGWSEEHDDEHEEFELAQAGACYYQIAMGSLSDQSKAGVPSDWPWAEKWWKPKDKLANLVRAGALIRAERERLERLEREIASEIDMTLLRRKQVGGDDADTE